MPKKANARAEQALELASRPLAELLALRDQLSAGAEPYQIGPRVTNAESPASPQAMFEAVARLELELPPQLVELYSLRNGLQANSKFLLSHILPAEELRLGRGYFPSLSARCERDWRDWGASHRESKAVIASQPTWRGLLAADVSAEIPFEVLDKLIVVSAHERRPRAVILSSALGPFPAGAVMTVENLRAITYQSVSHYISNDIAGIVLGHDL